jgi:hypothetical protein
MVWIEGIAEVGLRKNALLSTMIFVGFMIYGKQNLIMVALYYNRFGKNVIDDRPVRGRCHFFTAHTSILTLVEIFKAMVYVSVSSRLILFVLTT